MTQRKTAVVGLIATLVALAAAAALTQVHYLSHTQPHYNSVCAISEQVNCQTVALSPYAVFAGLPVSVWALFGYAVQAMLWIVCVRAGALVFPSLLGAGAAVQVGVSAWLAYVSHARIGVLCPYCAVLYGVAVVHGALTVLDWVQNRRSPLRALRADAASLAAHRWRVAAVVGLVGVGVAATYAWMPRYWVHLVLPDLQSVPSGVTDDGYPYLGSARPLLVIEEFSDYQCPYCRTVHPAMRRKLAPYWKYVRLVHRNFPVDPRCNPLVRTGGHGRACEFALAAACAARQGAFWPMNDALYAVQNQVPTNEVDIAALARAVGIDAQALTSCVRDELERDAVVRDVQEGIRRGVSATPTYFIGAQPYPGGVPEFALQAQIAAARARAAQESADQ